MIKISVIIPTFNRKKQLKKCLEELFRQKYPAGDFEILVSDDGSTDGTEEIIKKLNLTYRTLHLAYFKQRNQGPAKARNLGLRKSRGEIVAFTDDDCLPDKNWLAAIDKAFKKDPKILGVEGKTFTYPNKVTPLTHQIVNTSGGSYQTCNMAYRRKILERIGGFDKHFPFPHCDDIDLALRVKKLGQIYFEPKMIVTHPPISSPWKRELGKVNYITAELYLFLKHPDYFQEKYDQKNLYFQVVFVNSIWIRLFHLKLHFPYLKKNLFLYLEFFLRTLIEIGLIFILLPKFYLSYLRLKRSVHV